MHPFTARDEDTVATADPVFKKRSQASLDTTRPLENSLFCSHLVAESGWKSHFSTGVQRMHTYLPVRAQSTAPGA